MESRGLIPNFEERALYSSQNERSALSYVENFCPKYPLIINELCQSHKNS